MRLKLKYLHLERAVAVLDLETTGTDVRNDRIVEIAMLKLFPDRKPSVFHTLVHPGRPIPAAATLVHTITDADVAGKPRFREIAQDVYRFLRSADLIGFGLVAFDLPLLIAEFARAGCRFRLRGRSVIDVLELYRRMEPRDLSSAVRYYLGREHADAHSARADVRATLEVLDALVRRYGLPRTAAGLHAALIEVDVGRRFRLDPEGRVVLNFGKYLGRPLAEVADYDPGYLEWMLGQPFLEDVHRLVRRALAGQPLHLAEE